MNILQIVIFFKLTIVFTLKTIHLGFLFPLTTKNLFNLTGYNLSAGIVSIALDKIAEEQLLPNYELKFSTKFDECSIGRVSGCANELVNQNVDIIIGPSCSKAAATAYYHAKFYNKALITWGVQSYNNFDDFDNMPNLISMNPLQITIYRALIDFLKFFNWKTLAFISASDDIGRCSNILNGLLSAFESEASDLYFSITYQTSNPPTLEDYEYFINNVKDKSRIILICFDSSLWRRQFYLKIYDMKLNMNEYVLLNIENKYGGFSSFQVDEYENGLNFYQDYNIPPDGRDNDAMEIAEYSFFIDFKPRLMFNESLRHEILGRIEGYPFYCKDCSEKNYNKPSVFSPNLYDGVYMWAKILNTTLGLYGDKALTDPSLYIKHCEGTYKGILNDFSFDSDCFKKADIFITGLNDDGTTTQYIEYYFSRVTNFSKIILKSDLEATMFKKWGMSIPLNVPKCGYLGNRCIKSFIVEYKTWFVIICIVCGIILSLIILCTINMFYIFHKKKMVELYVWKINPNNIEKISTNNVGSGSLGSFHSTATSINSNNSFMRKKETNKYFYGFYNGNLIVARKHSLKFIDEKVIVNETKDCFMLEHDNINKFFGMSVEPGHIYSIWRYCKRGSLFDLLESGNSIIDTFFCYNMLTDLLEGLIYIHQSPIQFHGTLTSKKCLISDHWQLKISDFNTKKVRKDDNISSLEKLWIAPELLRLEDYTGSTEGDIYSVGIIASEIFTKNHPWNFSNRKESLEELVYLIKRGGVNPIRPELCSPDDLPFSQTAYTLCRECWKENPKERPLMKNIATIHKEVASSKTKNLMDHVFANLEEYSDKLKNEVEDRSKEVQEEKKKSDILLKKMLPPQIAEKLKIGVSVPPEDFDNVTIFFSDIVKFTTLSQKCSPFQVVNILNDLFSQFDNIIESLDVYKVETTGDGYLCVSGLPTRNGNNHVVEIANLALRFIEVCNTFKIAHLPKEKVMIRVGCNTGPCTAGVVGLSMPRYCLFGDTVNTASRMESNGKPGRIHTTESFYLLLSTFGSFLMEHRGEIIIKGKGVMNTYWLNGVTGSFDFDSSNYAAANKWQYSIWKP